MKDYFCIQYTSFLNSNLDSDKLLNPFEIILSEDYNKDDTFFSFPYIEGEQIVFYFLNGKIYYDKESEFAFKRIDEEYDIQNKLLSYYENILIYGYLTYECFYVFAIANIDNDSFVNYYELINITSQLGLRTPIVITQNKIRKEIETKNSILTQFKETSFKDKVFLYQ